MQLQVQLQPDFDSGNSNISGFLVQNFFLAPRTNHQAHGTARKTRQIGRSGEALT